MTVTRVALMAMAAVGFFAGTAFSEIEQTEEALHVDSRASIKFYNQDGSHTGTLDLAAVTATKNAVRVNSKAWNLPAEQYYGTVFEPSDKSDENPCLSGDRTTKYDFRTHLQVPITFVDRYIEVNSKGVVDEYWYNIIIRPSASDNILGKVVKLYQVIDNGNDEWNGPTTYELKACGVVRREELHPGKI